MGLINPRLAIIFNIKYETFYYLHKKTHRISLWKNKYIATCLNMIPYTFSIVLAYMIFLSNICRLAQTTSQTIQMFEICSCFTNSYGFHSPLNTISGYLLNIKHYYSGYLLIVNIICINQL